MDDVTIVGRTRHKGDMREGAPKVSYSDRHGLVYPALVEYDEDTDVTTIEWTTQQVES